MNILIIGDSWGVGEWPDPAEKSAYTEYRNMNHYGLAQYLEEAGHNVVNLSEGGKSNKYISWMLKFYLQRVNKNIDLVYIFQTEFYKELVLEEFDTNSFEHLLNQYNSRFLRALSEISQDYNVKINLIGGASDTDNYPNLESDFPGVKIACQSLVNLLVNSDPNVSKPLFSYVIPKNKLIEFKNKFDDLEFILDFIDAGLSRGRQIQTNKFLFWPDGSHPNRIGHKILFDYLTKHNTELIINNNTQD